MPTLDRIALSADGRMAESPRTLGSIILAYCIAFPLFGRAVFPMLRDKAHITLASSFTDPQMLATYLLAAIVTFRICTASNLSTQTNGRVVRMLVVFIAAGLISSLNSRFPLFAIWRCFEVSLLTMWAFVMIHDARGAGDPSRTIRAFYGISVAILIGVFVGLIINPSGAWNMEGDVARLTGSTGYSINSNDIGAIAAVIAVGCYVRAVERGSLNYTAAAVLFLAVCYVSHSRASYIALAIGFLGANVMFGRLPHRRGTIFALTLLAVLAIGALALVSQEITGFFVFLMTRGHEAQNLESFGGRLQLWELGLQLFNQHPFLGTGYGTYPEGLEGGHFHNVFIELLVTTGLVGVVSYVAFLVALIAATKRAVGRANQQLVAERIMTADLVTIPTVIIVANNATVGAAYYSWDLLGLVSVAVACSVFMVRRDAGAEEPAMQKQFSNLLR